MDREELARLVREQALTSGEAQEVLGVSRQRLHVLVGEGRLTPVKSPAGVSIFLRTDVEVVAQTLAGRRARIHREGQNAESSPRSGV